MIHFPPNLATQRNHAELLDTPLESLKQLRIHFESYLKENASNDFPGVLSAPYHHIMDTKGKRLRPLMMMVACQAFDGDIQQTLGPASAVEIFHNFSLVHDDIIDNADTRRGKPAVHKSYGLNRAILVGDAMLLHSYIQLSKGPEDRMTDILRVYNTAASQVIEGEQCDVDFEDMPEVSEEDYMTMIKNKTSVLLAASLQIGAIIGGASKEDQQHIYDFGLNLGLAFQIKDDYLDAYGDEETFGKKIGGDIVQNKKTYLLVHTMKLADQEQKQKIHELSAEKDEQKKIAAMLEMFDALDIAQQTHQKMEDLFRKSLESLRALSIGDRAKRPLQQLAQLIYERQH